MRNAVILALCVTTALLSNASAQRPTEYEVKAAFLYNFAKFTEWPSRAFGGDDAPIVIGVLGKDPFGVTLDQTIRGKTVRGRRLEIVRFGHVEDDLKRCHILFIGPSETGRLEGIFESLEGSSVLTVGEGDGFCQRGGVINFVLRQNRVRFEISVDAAERSGLSISSKLLKLAKIVRVEKPKERN